ncbi:hypothetical protein EGR_04692 [Echinococcus granulosus]|uniref:Uncharacterized protein n=1 Tax=Echinococcus granulosus TaxID=6210 RepID=W6UHF1_ECHGR|nr:hypothetical protein EGR_04692 [Echinococcus granulosus]EUB60498.1 hypothetical protein EGR_04692 [Echinococcus granulosus]
MSEPSSKKRRINETQCGAFSSPSRSEALKSTCAIM